MEIGGKAMATEENEGTRWDGKSRVSNDLYRKRHEEIFGKKTKYRGDETFDEILEIEENEEYVKELKDKL